MTHSNPTRTDHERFCRTEGWQPLRDVRTGSGTRHTTYELALPDGRVLRTRISHPPERDTYGPALWKHVLDDQLRVSEAEFRACVDEGVLPDRGVPRSAAEALPPALVYLLINRVGLPESEVKALSKEQAVARVNQYWFEGD
ncbi:cytotoxic translational repressor of toxin-antitoxin stability system [Haloactinomyces albus]|uniref:Cytotoxic translational repressor of toxin-antitoxin stability system n=1 Tax=Haloactinomyces albus TaxID=1352928 RepID=A0AAE4CMD1_9ACTN|nr:cytotoxic translational repressor of toxin-antitoxin stability system [Haloactinomyces albus]MDR7302739.1 hypothetical protein [Haloactinomyces albus]